MKWNILAPIVIVVLLAFSMSSTTAAAPAEPAPGELSMLSADNVDLWYDMTNPYTKDLPEEIKDMAFFGYVLSMVLLGVFMKTRSAGALVIMLMVFGLLLSSVIDETIAVIFRAFVAVACAILLFMLFKNR